MAKKYIKNFYNRDRLALTSISRCGYCNKEQIKEFIADKRITNYLRDGIVIKETLNKNNGEKLEAYKLTAKGRNLLEKEWGVKGHYIAQSISHDLAIANKYFSLSQSERETWKTETEIREQFEARLYEIKSSNYQKYEEIQKMIEDKLISVPDCYFQLENKIEVYYEVITNSYSRSEIEAKERFIEFMNIKNYQTERV